MRAEHAAGQRDDERQHGRLGQQLGRPRQRHRHVREAPLGGQADGADERARAEADGERAAAGQRERRQLDEHGLDDVERVVHERVAEAGPDDQHHRGHDQQVGAGRGQRAAAAEPQARGDQGDARRQRDEHGVEDELELRHAEAELELQGREADQRRAGELDLPGEQHLAPARVRAARRAAALDQQQPRGDRRQRGAADHQHVGRAPERDVLAEEAVPDVVEREAEHGDRAAQQQQRAAERDAPAGRQRERRAVAIVGAEHAGQEAGQRDAAEPEQDRVVRDVGERAGVAAVVDVGGDVPEEAEGGDPERAERDQHRQRRPARHGHHALGQARQAAEQRHAPRAMAGAEHQRGGGQHARHERRGDEILHGGATGGLAGGEELDEFGRHQVT